MAQTVSTITTGGTAQNFETAGLKTWWYVKNNSTGRLWVSDNGSPATQNSIEIPPGQYYETPDVYSTTNTLSILGLTTGQQFYSDSSSTPTAFSNLVSGSGAKQDLIPIYGSLAERPSASAFGIGMCQIGSNLYVSNGVVWSAGGGGGGSSGTNPLSVRLSDGVGIKNYSSATYASARAAFQNTKKGLGNSSVMILGDSIQAGTNELGVSNLIAPPTFAARTLRDRGVINAGYQTVIGAESAALWDVRDPRLAPTTADVTFVASIAGTVMTVTGTPTGTLAVNQVIKGPGIVPGTYIKTLGTGTGGAGTYNISIAHTLNSSTFTGYNAAAPAGFNAFAVNDFFRGSTLINNTTTNPLTFIPDTLTDTLEIVYFDNSGYNAFSVTANGSAIGTATITGTGNWKKEIFKAPNVGYHTYTVVRTATGSSILPAYIRCYNSNEPEVSVFNAASPGASGNTWFGITPAQAWSTLNAIAHATIKPSLAIICFGVNDMNNAGLSISTFETYMNLGINALKAAGINVVLATCLPWVTSGVATQSRQDLFYNSIINLATTQGIAYLDIYDLWGRSITTSVANGLTISTSDGHPTTLGQRVLGNYIADVVETILNN